jgi:hypothetical protein
MTQFSDPVDYTPDGVALFGADRSLLVKFFTHPQISKVESEAAGRPVYKDVVMVEVIQPGEKEPVRQLANDFHKIRFARQWENFEKGKAETHTGTPLELLFLNEPGTILNLNSFNVFTIEQLANITDTAITSIPMGRQLADRAKSYVSTATGGAMFHKMQTQIAELTRKLEDQAAQLANKPAETATAPARRGPGRPPRAAVEGETA